LVQNRNIYKSGFGRIIMAKENEENGFGVEKTKTAYDDFIGMYITVYPISSSNNFSGRLIRIEDHHLILNPFLGSKPDKEKGQLVRKMVYEESKTLMPVVTIEPTTKEDLELICEIFNRNDSETLKKYQPEPK
jgi:hypothetical protein